MKKLYFLMLFPLIAFSQVGINTTTPNAQLDIQSTNQANPSNTDGILIPKVDAFPSTNPGANQNGMLVFLTTTIGSNTPGFYYWNHPTAWVPIGNNNNSGWNLNGNTITAGQFIGTTNNEDLILRRGNLFAGRISEISGASNTSYGVNSLNLTTTGSSNNAFGRSALRANTTGNSNNAFGTSAMFNNTEGLFNSAFGQSALGNNTLGDNNSAFGYMTLRDNTLANENSAFGRASLLLNTTGSSNSGFGINTLETNTIGSRNTAVGSKADVATNNLNNATAIGANAQVSASNSLVLGSINGVNGATADVNVGIATTSPQEKLHVVGNIRMVDGNESAGRIMVSDANGTSTWTDASTIASGTLDQAYDFGGAGNGKTITADNGAVLINGADGLVSTGILNSGAIAPSGDGVKMFWNPRKGAFRAGETFSNKWDDPSVGIKSVAMGHSTRASGSFSTAFGNDAEATGSVSTAFGINTNANGSVSTVFGRVNNANGDHSFVTGINNFGNSFAETVIGIGATTYVPSVNGSTAFRAANATDRLFVIGNAIDSNNSNFVEPAERSDAMIVLKNGLTRLPSTTNAMIDAADGKAVVTKEWVGTNAINTAWSLTGNTGINPTTNFIGTSDNNDLAFRTNNTQQALLMGSGKFIFGNSVPSSDTWAGFSKTIIGTDDTDNDLTFRSSGTDIPAFNILRSNGTMASPTEFSGGELGSIRFWRYSGIGPFDGYTAAGRIVSGVSSTGASSLSLSGAQASHVIITNTGNVGIGVSPQRKFHVVNTGVSGGTSIGNSGFLLESNTDVYQHFLTPNANESGLLFGSDTASIHGGIIFDNSDQDLSFRTGGNTTRMTLASSGNLGLGTATPSRNIHVLGNSASTTNGQLYLEQSGTGDAIIHIGNTGARHYNLGLDTSTENFKIATHATTATSLTSSTLVTVQPTGEVGIGTTTPDQKLHVSGPAGLTAIKITNTSTGGATSNVALDFQRGGNSNTDWRIYNIGPNLTIANSGDELTTINDLYQFQINRFMPMNDEVINLGQGTNKWNTVFALNGTINTSDLRQKKNIQNLSYGLDKLMQLRPVSFEWKKDDGSGTKLGLIAQELQQVIPEVVRDWDWDEDELGNRKKVAASILGVYYSDLIPVLIKATQEQQQIIENQNNEITNLKSELNTLQASVQELISRIKTIETSKN